jgi:hypothetical protein
MKNLENVKSLANEGKIQESLEILSDICFDLDLYDLFMGKYQTGEWILGAYGNDLNNNCIEIEPDGTFYESYELADETTMVIEVVKESVLKTISEVEDSINKSN